MEGGCCAGRTSAHEARNPLSGHRGDALGMEASIQARLVHPIESSFQVKGHHCDDRLLIPRAVDCVGKYQEGLLGCTSRASAELGVR